MCHYATQGLRPFLSSLYKPVKAAEYVVLATASSNTFSPFSASRRNSVQLPVVTFLLEVLLQLC